MMVDPDWHMLKAGPSVLASTATGGLYRGIGGYLSYEEQIGSNQSWSTIQKNYWKSKGYSHASDGVDGYPMELNPIYGRYGSKINILKRQRTLNMLDFINYMEMEEVQAVLIDIIHLQIYGSG